MISPSNREKEEKILSKPSKKKKGRWTKNDTELTVMALPTTIWYILFCFLPMFGLIIAFKNYKITGGKSFIYNLLHSDWAGFKNFSFLIRSNDLFVILRNTILYNLAFIVLGMVFSVGLAIMISLLHNKRASKVYQTMMFFPYFMSWVVASYFLDAFLNQDNGLINSIMRNAGKEPIQWYMSAGVWPFILIFMYLWKSTGYNMVIYLSSISGIDTTLYEAAVMDGANKRQQVWHITLPCLKSVIIMMFILNVGLLLRLRTVLPAFSGSKRFDLQNDSNYRHICIQRTAVFHSDRNDFCGNILPVCCMLHHHPSCQCHCEED